MKRRNLPLNALRAFESAARHASVSGAARELAVTHSAVSHQLKQLEARLETRLFERSHRGLQITPAGEALLPAVSESFDRIDATLTNLGRDQPQDQIRVTSTPSFASKWLLPRLGEWYRNSGACRVQLLPGLDDFDLVAERIDLAIRCGKPPWPGCQHELLMPIHLVPVCSPAYAAEHDTPVSAEAALSHPLIHADIDGQPPGQEWRDWLGDGGIECQGQLDGISLKDPALAMQAAADGLGLAIGYQELIDRDLNAGRLVCANDRHLKHEASYYLVYRGDIDPDTDLGRFLQWIREQR